MKFSFRLTAGLMLVLFTDYASATQADDTSIIINSSAPGITVFIAQLSLTASDTTVIKSISFSIKPKPGSVTRPLTATYSSDYLLGRGFLQPTSGDIFLPVYGLYDSYSNTVTLTYNFLDGSSKEATTTITTQTFSDPCGYKNPTVLQARTSAINLSYDYFLIKENCAASAPAIMDTDGAIRWVGPSAIDPPVATAFFDNAIYRSEGTSLYRIELDGAVTFLHDYSDIGVISFHHNIDPGKFGLICCVNTAEQSESTNIEVDPAGNVLKIWSLADIISAAMLAGGDDPSQFVSPAPADWFHNNATSFNCADDSVIISSRENFLICLDYDTSAIKWILGDPTKAWHGFPSLAKYGFDLAPGTLPPIGQHAPSIAYNQELLVFDNGFQSTFHFPQGANRNYASPRRYQLDLGSNLATEVWNFEMNQSINSPICGSVYEDAPFNYLIDYAYVGGFYAISPFAQLLGLDSAGNTVFYYQYPTNVCDEAFNSFPLHMEKTSFPTVGPQSLNISARASISSGDNVLIAGFVVTGTANKQVCLRVLGPSLSNSGVSSPLTDPELTLYNASGKVIASNDDWTTDANASEITSLSLAPSNASEAATIQTLAPGAYTVVGSGKGNDSGVGVVEVYDISPTSGSRLANISARGFVGLGEDELVSGFIVGDVGNSTLIIRAIGPSLGGAVPNPVGNPMLSVYDSDGSVIATNDDWQNDPGELDIIKNGLAPGNSLEAATLLHPPAGAYTVVVTGEAGATGIGLVEVYDLDP